MHPRVKPSDIRVQSNHEMPSFLSEHAVVEVFPDASPNCLHEKEEMLKASENIYSPILKTMKLCGIYFGDTSLKRLSAVPSNGRRRSRASFSFLYCFVAVACLWFHFAMTFVSLCLEGISVSTTFFTLLTICSWSLITALSGTICAIVLPSTEAKKSLFENFIQHLVKCNADLQKLRCSSRKIFIAAGLFWIISVLSNIIIFLFFPLAFVANFKPWNGRYGFKVVGYIIQTIFLTGVSPLAVVFICITCLVIEEVFDEFCKRASSNNVKRLDLEGLKDEHRKLYIIVELASKMLSPLLLILVALYIPLLCFLFFVTIHPPALMSDERLTFQLGCVYWLLVSAGTVAIILVYGSKVNDKVSNDSETTSNNTKLLGCKVS